LLFCGSLNSGGGGWVLNCYEKRDCSEFFLRAVRELCGSAIKGGLKMAIFAARAVAKFYAANAG